MTIEIPLSVLISVALKYRVQIYILMSECMLLAAYICSKDRDALPGMMLAIIGSLFCLFVGLSELGMVTIT